MVGSAPHEDIIGPCFFRGGIGQRLNWVLRFLIHLKVGCIGE